MRARDRILLTLAAMLMLGAGPVAAQETQPADPAVVADPAKGLPAWEKIYAVFSHPRCANCHVEGERPMWSGPHYGATRAHAFNVQRGADGSGFGNAGMRCTTCHFESNSNVLHGPPGAENWHLAPAEMVWFGKSSVEICAQIKDPNRNGERTLEEVATHVRDDKLVGWGWSPGPGREPAPGSAAETFDAIKTWTAAGAPCPSG
jgi:hypothetical protein